MKVFSLKKVSIRYGKEYAISDVSMDIKRNRVTALIGPSGCGKSTLLRALNRMNDLIKACHIEGEIIYETENIYARDYDVIGLRTDVGMVFQKPNPFPMSIFDNVAYGPMCAGIKNKDELRKIVNDALKDAALYDEVKDKLNRSALDLSGGQQQRLCIARALAMKPQVVLMDEPTSALDPIATAKIEDLIYKLKQDYTIIIVTHNMQQAARISDDTAFLYMGDLIEFDATETLFTTPSKTKTEEYITGRFG